MLHDACNYRGIKLQPYEALHEVVQRYMHTNLQPRLIHYQPEHHQVETSSTCVHRETACGIRPHRTCSNSCNCGKHVPQPQQHQHRACIDNQQGFKPVLLKTTTVAQHQKEVSAAGLPGYISTCVHAPDMGVHPHTKLWFKTDCSNAFKSKTSAKDTDKHTVCAFRVPKCHLHALFLD